MATLRAADPRVIGYQESIRTWTATHWRLMHRYRRAARRAARRHDYHAAARLMERAAAHQMAYATLVKIHRENAGGPK